MVRVCWNNCVVVYNGPCLSLLEQRGFLFAGAIMVVFTREVEIPSVECKGRAKESKKDEHVLS